jgi:putative ABC transport system permease protein
VGDVRDAALTSEPRPTTYVPIAQLPDTVMEQTMGSLPLTWIVRTSGESQRLTRAIEQELERVSSLPVAHVQRLSDIMRQSISDKDFYLGVMSALGSAALLLAVIGLNGVIRYAVLQRTKEIGRRVALGAEPSDVRNMVVVQGMRLAAAAVAVGIAGAFAPSRFVAAFLFGVTDRDLLMFVSVPAIVMVAALLAVWLPARAITTMDAVRALRHE